MTRRFRGRRVCGLSTIAGSCPCRSAQAPPLPRRDPQRGASGAGPAGGRRAVRRARLPQQSQWRARSQPRVSLQEGRPPERASKAGARPGSGSGSQDSGSQGKAFSAISGIAEATHAVSNILDWDLRCNLPTSGSFLREAGGKLAPAVSEGTQCCRALPDQVWPEPASGHSYAFRLLPVWCRSFAVHLLPRTTCN